MSAGTSNCTVTLTPAGTQYSVSGLHGEGCNYHWENGDDIHLAMKSEAAPSVVSHNSTHLVTNTCHKLIQHTWACGGQSTEVPCNTDCLDNPNPDGRSRLGLWLALGLAAAAAVVVLVLVGFIIYRKSHTGDGDAEQPGTGSSTRNGELRDDEEQPDEELLCNGQPSSN